MQTTNSDFIDIMEKNHMEIPWHDYANDDSNVLIAEAGLIEKASVIGRVGLIMLSCGTGAWRVRTSMNRLSKELGVTCTVDVGLMSIVFNCFDGNDCISQSLSIANTGVNTSKLYLFIHLQSWGLPQLLPAAVLLFYSEADRLRWLLLLLPPGLVI